MSNIYDRIFKENMPRFSLGVAKRLLKLPIEKVETINMELQKTLERKPDFVAKARLNGEWVILHIEFQATDDRFMFTRQGVYRNLLWEKIGYKYKIIQHVIYFGTKPVKYMYRVPNGGVRRYDVHPIRDYSHQLFLNGDSPEEVILGIFANFDGQPKERIIKMIFERISALSKGDLERAKRCAKQLEILALSRNLQETVINIRKLMPFVFDIKKDLRYQAGKKEGKEEGKEELMKQVLQHGIHNTLKTYIQSLIERKQTPEQVAKELNYPLPLIEKIFKEIEEANKDKG